MRVGFVRKGFIRRGWRTLRRRRPLISIDTRSPAEIAFDHDVALVRDCLLFDASWYLETNPDVRAAGLDPVAHYVSHGAGEGRSPGPAFDSGWYRMTNADVRDDGVNPLIHYLVHGAAEGRAPSADFDGAWYLDTNPDVREAGVNPLIHYVEFGRREGRALCSNLADHEEQHPAPAVEIEPPEEVSLGPDLSREALLISAHPLFDSRWYRAIYRDVAAAGVDPALHYLRWGAAEGRDPGPYFRTSWYARSNVDDLPQGMNPLVHYITVGEAEGRPSRPAVLRTRARPA